MKAAMEEVPERITGRNTIYEGHKGLRKGLIVIWYKSSKRFERDLKSGRFECGIHDNLTLNLNIS